MVLMRLSVWALLLSALLTLVNATADLIMGGLQPIAYERVDSILHPGSVSLLFAAVGSNDVLNSFWNKGRVKCQRYRGPKQLQPEREL